VGAVTREQEIRERLFDVLGEFPVLYQARQGLGSKILNPFSSLEKVVRAHVNPLILYINDALQEIARGTSYVEALDRVTVFALQYKYRDRVIEAVRQLAKIEGERPYFLWGLASLKDAPDVASRVAALQALHRKLHLMNKEYSKRFGTGEGSDLIPWRVSFRKQMDGITDGTYEYPTRRQLDIFRVALLGLDRLVREQRLDRLFFRGTYRKVRQEMTEIATLLFDYGYTVEEICGKVHDEGATPTGFLNDLLLSELESTACPQMDLATVSRHVILLSLIDFRVMVPFRTFYARPSRIEEAMAAATEIERKLRIKVSPFRRVIQLFQRYREAQPPLLSYYLEYRFTRVHGDYLPQRGADHFGIDLTKKFVLRYYDNQDVQAKATEEVQKLYSSKASGEMLEVLNLLISALSHPENIRGKRVSILGHIQSGAMGKVLIGVHQGNIVALKEAKATRGSAMPLSEMARHLEYEARLHGHVQAGNAQHENIVECFGVIEEEDHRYLAIGYHPAETLGPMVQKTRVFSLGGSQGERSPLVYRDLRTVTEQMLRALTHLRDRQVIHRDLKPANVLYLVDQEGGVNLIKVIDFGVALGIGEDHPPDLFQRQVVGTMAYMAPELVLTQSSYASDLFSAGAIFYQLMSGSTPLVLGRPRTKAEIKIELTRVVKERRKPLNEANPRLASIPGVRDLTHWVDRMITLDPTQRPPVDVFQREWQEIWERVPEEVLGSPVIYPV
jgi:hypothetical protein